MIARYASAVTAGTLITLSLLYAMQSLIHLKSLTAVEVRDRHELVWLDKMTEERPPEVIEAVINKEILENVPVDPALPQTSGSGTGLRVTTVTPGPGPVTTTLTGIAQPDGPLISIVRVQPNYPAAAEVRGLEGWVDVRFDVTVDGRVVNVEVIGSSSSLFESAAINAAQRFRFRAPVVNGLPQVATAIEYRFRFEMPH